MKPKWINIKEKEPPLNKSIMGYYSNVTLKQGTKELICICYKYNYRDDNQKLCKKWSVLTPLHDNKGGEIGYTEIVKSGSPEYWAEIPQFKLPMIINKKSVNRFQLMEIE